jgi:hypothetical protein
MLNQTIIVAVAAATLFIVGCKKKDRIEEPAPVSVDLPEAPLFVNTFDLTTGATIYVLNSSDGKLNGKLTYPVKSGTTWTSVAAGNGFLYRFDDYSINAINMNTGLITWTDAVNNSVMPILHDHTFFGVSGNASAAYQVYALEATKSSADYRWTYTVNTSPLEVKYYNGMLYVLLEAKHLAVLNAQTGTQMFDISATAPYSLKALNNGFIMAGNTIVDANTGTQLNQVTSPAIPLTYGAKTYVEWSLDYVTKDLYFISTLHADSSTLLATKFISAVDRATGNVKWTYKYDGGFASAYGVYNTIDQVWKDQLVVKNNQNTSDKIHTMAHERFWMLDINTGSAKNIYNDYAGFGKNSSGFISNNIHFFSQVAGTGNVFAPASGSSLFAVDLVNTKQVWRDDQLLKGYAGAVSICLFKGGQGFSPLIQ